MSASAPQPHNRLSAKAGPGCMLSPAGKYCTYLEKLNLVKWTVFFIKRVKFSASARRGFLENNHQQSQVLHSGQGPTSQALQSLLQPQDFGCNGQVQEMLLGDTL